jgi:hypothetical protein
MPQVAHDGGCLCGALRYRVVGAAISNSVCHCRSCRLASGATPVAWTVVPLAAWSWLQGAPALRRSSPDVERGFCAGCGTPLTYRHDANPGEIEFTTCTLDDPSGFAPTREIWWEHRLPWAASNPALPRYAHESAAGPLP